MSRVKTAPAPADEADDELADGRVRLHADTLKALRRQQGLSQSLMADLAREQGRPISIASIKRAELGAPVLYRTALQLAEMLRIDVERLLDQPATPALRPPKDDGLALVGRQAERRQFQGQLDELRQQGRGHIVYVRGPAGMGKSRLLAEWRDLSRQAGLRLVQCEVEPVGAGGGLGYLGRLLRAYFGLAPPVDDSHALMDQLRQRLRSLGLADPMAMALAPLMQLPLANDQQPIYQAMSHETRLQQRYQVLLDLVRHGCRDQPLVVMVEDLHWADEHLLDGLAPLMFATRQDPVLWVLTSRVEKDPLERSLRPYLPDVPVTVMDLVPLGDEDALALARTVPGIDAARLAECVAQARGNPLFLTQLLLHPDPGSLPETLNALVRSKLEQLPPQDRDAVTLAAAATPQFSLRLIRKLLGDEDYQPTEPLAQHLFRACGIGSYAFVHDLIRHGIALATPPEVRQRLFERLAEHHRGEDPRLLAVYLDKARHPDAPDALLQAIEHLCLQHRFEEAQELARHYGALDYAPIDRYRLHLQQGRIALGMGRPKEARSHLEQAQGHAPDLARRLPVVVLLARALNLLDELQAEEALLAEHIPLAQQAGDAASLGQLYYLQGNLLFPRGRHEEARSLHTAARRQARLAHDARTEAQALSGLGDSYYAQGRMLTATDTFRRCLKLCEQHSLADVEASNRFMLATTRLYLNETLAALGDALASAEIAHRVGNRRAEIVSRLTAGWLYLSLDRAPQALDQFNTGLEIARALGAARFEPFLMEGVSRGLLLTGEPDAALDTIRDAWARVERQSLHRFIGPWVLGTLAMMVPGERERRQAIEQGLAIVAQGCVAHNVYRFCVAAAEAHIGARDAASASALADRLEAFTKAEPCPWADHHIRLIRAHVDRLLRPFETEQATLDGLVAQGLLAGIGHASPRLHAVLPPAA